MRDRGALDRREALTVLRRVVLVAMCTASVANAQPRAVVEVRDDRDEPVPFALVSIVGGVSTVANDSGVVRLTARAADSLRLRVRRIGYREHFGWVRREGTERFVVVLSRLAASLSAVEVVERMNTPLARTGFYDRATRVQRGAIVGEFLTPEELDMRGGSTVTQLVTGSRYAKLAGLQNSRGPRTMIITGRGDCKMTVLVDGQVMHGTAQEDARDGGDSRFSIDDIIDGRSVAAVEIYPSTANAPVELVRMSGRGSCGIVALWTGARR